MHNQKHKENPNEDNKEQKINDFGLKELPNGRIYDKPPPNDYERVWNLKRNQYIKALKAGWNLPENIIKEYKLEEFLK